MNLFNDHLPFGLLAQLVGALYQYHRGQVSNSGKPGFIFCNSISRIFNCNDLFFVYFNDLYEELWVVSGEKRNEYFFYIQPTAKRL